MHLSVIVTHLVLPYVASVIALPVGDLPCVSSGTTGSSTAHCTSAHMVTAGGPYHSTLTASGKEIPVLERRTLITEDMTVEQHKGEETRYQNDHARHKEQEAHFRNLETQAGQDYKAEAASKTPNEARLKELAQTQECNRHRADESMHHALASQAGADYHKVKQVFVQDKRDEERHSPDPRRTLRLEENRGRLFGHSVQYRVHTSGAITKARLASSVCSS